MKPSESPKRGLIFNIQRFSIHDGPGIRTTVFMKGCPLGCLWCSNPESQDSFPNLIVRDIKCRNCGACLEVCPEQAIIINDQERKIDWSKCNQCLECVDACLYDSLNACGKYMEIEEVLDEVIRDMDFYRNSGGGITLSGGEVLLQSEFASRLLAASKEKGLHTVLDTSGFASWDSLEKVLRFVDMILWDIKHLDSQSHKKMVGVGNELILGNLRKAANLGKPIWLRVPLIAGFNDDEDHIRAVVALAKTICAEKVSLLPYHEGGVSKCEQLGRSYPLPEAKAPSDEDVNRLKTMIETLGIKASIGS